MPGTTIPEPSPLEHVTPQAQPSASSTEMCVVEPSREARKRSWKPSWARPSRNSGVARVLRRLHHLDQPPDVRRAGAALEQRERVGDEDPAAAGGGLVSTSRPR